MTLKSKAVFTGCLILAFSCFADIRITKTEFSTDGMKTWSLDLPILSAASPKFHVRVSYAAAETRPTTDGYIGSSLTCERDFASAVSSCNVHRTSNIEKPPRSWRYLHQPPRPVVFFVDLGERPAGVIDAQTKKPRPACPAFGPGTYRFGIDFTYWLDPKYFKGAERRVSTLENFMITVR